MKIKISKLTICFKTGVILIFILIILPLSITAQTTNIKLEHLTVEQGLSSASIFSICQDSKCFMWFGTSDGLNRYDGYDFIIYNHDPQNQNSLSDNWITCLMEDSAGKLWIGTRNGLNRFDPATEQFKRFLYDPNNPQSISNNYINCIYEEKRGGLWIGTRNGLNLYDPATETFRNFKHDPKDSGSLSSNEIFDIYEDISGILWIGTSEGLCRINRDDIEAGKFQRYYYDPANPQSISNNYIRDIYEDSDGILWIGTAAGGLNQYDPATGTFIRYKPDRKDPNSISSKTITRICEDSYGRLWIGTQGSGFDIFDKKRKRFIHNRHDANDPKSLSWDVVNVIYKDCSGVMWLGTYGTGIDLWHPTMQKFKLYTKDSSNPNSLGMESIMAIYEDPECLLWVSGYGGNKLDVIDRDAGRYMHFDREIIEPGNIRVIHGDRDEPERIIWFGTEASEFQLIKFNRQLKTVIKRYDIEDLLNTESVCVFTIYDDDNKVLWLGTDFGLVKFNKITEQFTLYKHNPDDPYSLSDNSIRALYEDSKGYLWVGTSRGGLNRFDRKEEKFICFLHDSDNPNSLSNNWVLSIKEDQDGYIWISTARGLNKYDRWKGIFTHFTTKNGFPYDRIDDILIDNNYNLWLLCGGVARFNMQNENLKVYDEADGCQSSTFNSNSSYKSSSGELFFGGTKGFNAFYPEEMKDNTYKSPVVITDFQISNQSVPIGEWKDGRTILEKSLTETQEIEISYKEKVLSFMYSTLNYVHPKKNQYAYMMEGLEKDWNYVGIRRFATYTTLPPGEYNFKVKGSNNDGVWNEEGTSLKIIVLPPFWQTWWFRFIGIVFVLSIIVVIHEVKTYNIKKRNIHLQELVEERTSELRDANKELESFSYSVSHDLRAPLRAIDGFTRILMEDYVKKLDAEGKRLGEIIQDNTKKMGKLIDDLLSFSHLGRASMIFSKIDMKNMVNAIYHEATSVIERKRITFTSAKLPKAEGDTNMMREVWINLISNAVKFSSQRKQAVISISCQEEENKLTYCIKDNGAGFNMKYKDKLFGVFQRLHSEKEFEGTGVGLALVQRIILRHGGDVWAEGNVDKGATFYFSLPKNRRI